MPRNLNKSEALVLRKRSLLGKDNLYSFFTRDYGKVLVVAKGIKKTTSRRAPHLQTANLIELEYNISHDRKYLSQTSLLSAFSNIKNNEKKVGYVYLVFFILDRMLPEDQPEIQAFNIAKRFLVALSRQNDFGDRECAEYLFQILVNLGYVKEFRPLTELLATAEEVIGEKIPTSVT